MGSREDHLDALLTALVPTIAAPSDSPDGTSFVNSGKTSVPIDPHLAPLLGAAEDLIPFATAQPNPAFAARLGQRILARAAQRRQENVNLGATESAMRPVRDDRAPAPAITGYPVASRSWKDILRRSVLRRTALAAVALVALGIGVWTLAMAYGAAPGSVFYNLHQVGQNVSLTFMSQQGRAQAHVQAARQLLDDLRVETNGRGDTRSYDATLTALLSENAAAAQAIQQMPAGAARDTLNAELAALRGNEQTALHAALPHIGWADRVATTQALASLGTIVPHVSGATVTQMRGLWQVVLRGSGFEAGAVLLIDGTPTGRVTAITSTSLTAQAPSGLFRNGPIVLGIGNPDGSAATTTVSEMVVAPTATPNGHGSNNGGNNPHGAPTHTPGGHDHGNSGSNVPESGGGH